ncbi:kinase-like domain-containing protein, partial [Mycena pura]
NILISNEWNACLADFGLTSFSDVTASTDTSHNRAGSLRWMAPELIDPEKFGQRFLRTPATDVYAFGCVCLELYTRQPPFADFRETAVIVKVSDGVRPKRPTCDPTMSDALWGLVNDCWAQQSTNRPFSKMLCQRFLEGDIRTDQVVSTDSKRRVDPPSRHLGNSKRVKLDQPGADGLRVFSA